MRKGSGIDIDFVQFYFFDKACECPPNFCAIILAISRAIISGGEKKVGLCEMMINDLQFHILQLHSLLSYGKRCGV